MPIDPSKVQWSVAPGIDVSQVKWDTPSAAKASTKSTPMTMEGLRQNAIRNIEDTYKGIMAFPDLVTQLGRGAYYAATDTPIPTDVLPSESAAIAAEKQLASELPGRIYEGGKQMLTEAVQHPEQIPGKIGRWMYENPADALSLASVPAAKGLTAAATGLRGAEAAAGAGAYARGLGAAAQAAETGAKVAPWLDVMHPAELAGRKLLGASSGITNWARSVAKPKTAELIRTLGPTDKDVLRALTATEVPQTPFVHTQAAATPPPPARPALTVGEQLTRSGKAASAGRPQLTGEVGSPTAPKTEVPPAGGSKVDAAQPAEGYEDVFASFRSAGETAANEGPGGRIYAAMQEKASKYTPETNRAYLEQKMQRDALRKQITDEAAGSPKELEVLTEQAGQAGSLPYTAAKNLKRAIDLAPVNELVAKAINSNLKNRDLVTALRRVQKNLYVKTGKLESAPTTVASIIDDLKGQIGKRENSHIKKQLVEVKNALYKQFPEYADADALYRKGWAPAHQRQIATYLRDVLDQKGEKAFLDAYDNMETTIRRATGETMFKSYDSVFEGNESLLQNLRSVRDDVASELNYKKMAQDPHAQAAVRDLFTPELISSPGLLNAVYTMSRWLVHRAQGRMTEKAATEMALEMLHPKTAAPAVERALSRRKRDAAYAGALDRFAKSTLRPGTGVVYSTAGELEDEYNMLRDQQLQNFTEGYNATQYGEVPQSPYIDIYDMGEDYGVTPVAPEQ